MLYTSKNYGCIALHVDGGVQILPIEGPSIAKDGLNTAKSFAKYRYIGELAIFDKYGKFYPIKK